MKAVVINSVARAMEVVKEMNASSTEWSDECRAAGRNAIAGFLRDRMKESISDYLARLPDKTSDRKNGSYLRHLLTELGDIVLSVPRTRRYIPLEILKAYARRCAQVDGLILACFLLGALYQEGRGGPFDHPWREGVSFHRKPGGGDIGCGGCRLP